MVPGQKESLPLIQNTAALLVRVAPEAMKQVLLLKNEIHDRNVPPRMPLVSQPRNRGDKPPVSISLPSQIDRPREFLDKPHENTDGPDCLGRMVLTEEPTRHSCFALLLRHIQA
jgi:hypothetical protein